MSKCKLCPMKKHCKDECYGETPCAFALAFDRLAHKLDLKTVCIESLKDELRQMKEEPQKKEEHTMKVYIRNNGGCYDYPIQMEKILNYLTERGALIVPGSTVEELYRDFSDKKYDASWMHVTPEILEEFEDWLATVEI